MSKSIIIAAAVSAIFIAAPAFAQDSCPGATAGHVKVFDGNDGPIRSFAPTRNAPGRTPGFEGPHGSATNLRDTPSSDPTAGRGHGFDGPNGSASNLRDAPRPNARHIPDAKVSCRKTGGDGAAPGRHPGFEGPHGSATNLRDTPSSDPTASRRPATRPSRGVTKVGAGTLQ